MVNSQLLEFVRLQLKFGSSEVDIRKALASATWTPADINEAFAMLNISTATATPIQSPTAIAIVAPPSTPGQLNPRTEIQSQTTTLQQVATLQANVSVKQTPKVARHHWIAWIICIALLILIVIIVASAAFNFIATSSGQEQARDLKRVADLQGLQVGIILYHGSYSIYPTVLTSLVPQYVSQIPVDVKTNNPYSYHINGSMYQLCANMEESKPPLPSPLRSDQTFSGGEYCVTSNTY
jgi:hypothetical protein